MSFHISPSSNLPTGLSRVEAATRAAEGRINRDPGHSGRSVGSILASNVFSLFNAVVGTVVGVLLVAWTVHGDFRLVLDAVGVSSVALVNTLIAIVQEIRAKRALDRVSLLLRHPVTVVREGEELEVDPGDLVEGEVIRISRGDQVVVDGRVLRSYHLEVDESLLTGESVAIPKDTGDELRSGSFAVAGSGYYEAEKVGAACYAVKLQREARADRRSTTPLQRRLDTIVKVLFGVALALVGLRALSMPAGELGSVGFIREAATIAIALVPQGLVLMASVSFALGVYRISRRGAIVQRLNAIESFSHVSVICTDKTGTLTQNQLTLHTLTCLTKEDEARFARQVGTFARLCPDPNATLRALTDLPADPDASAADAIPFSSTSKMSLIRVSGGAAPGCYVLGGFDILAERLDPGERRRLQEILDEKGLSDYRNLMLGMLAPSLKLEDIRTDAGSLRFEALGVASLTDSIRPDALAAIRTLADEGISLKVLSGDAPATLRAVCRDVGWQVPADAFYCGSDLDALDSAAFDRAVESGQVFGRLTPEHKKTIVRRLRALGHHTAMLGDGVNDLPAIKEADLGIAMEEGCTATKEVADIVLLENRFSLLPAIFAEGNRIVNTVAGVAKLFLTKNAMVVWLTLATSLFALQFPLTPRRVALINLFAIGLPALVLATHNTDTSRNRRFLPEVAAFVILSSLVVAFAGHLGLALVGLFPALCPANGEERAMVMLGALIFTSIANYFAIFLTTHIRERRAHTLYGAFLLGGGLLLMGYRGQNGLMPVLQTFYEITRFPLRIWPPLLLVGGGGAALLLGLQRCRQVWITRRGRPVREDL